MVRGRLARLLPRHEQTLPRSVKLHIRMDEILDIKETMKRLKLSYRTVLALIHEGTLPAAMVKGKWRIIGADLIFMLERLKGDRG